MSVYILRWNPAISSYKKENHKDLVCHLDKGEIPLDFNWSIREWENLKKDDFFILQQVGTDNDGIAMFGKFKGPCYESGSWRKDGSKLYYADMWIMDAFDCEENNILPAKRYEKLFPEIKWHGGHSGVVVPPKIAGDLIMEIEKDMIKAEIWDNESLDNFRAYEGPVGLDDEKYSRPTAEDLADGKILLQIKHNFLENQSEQNFVSLICCLHDSTVKVPMHVEIPDNVKDQIQKLIQEGKEEWELPGDPKFYPMTLGNDEGETAMAIFSNEDEIGDNYSESEDCIFADIPVLECIEFFNTLDDCDAIILDAFTDPLRISKEMAGLISTIAYKEESEE